MDTALKRVFAEEELEIGESDDEEELDELEIEEGSSSDPDDSFHPDVEYDPDTEEEEELISSAVKASAAKNTSKPSTPTAVTSVSDARSRKMNKKQSTQKNNVEDNNTEENEEDQAAKLLKFDRDEVLARDGDYIWKSDSIRNITGKTASENIPTRRTKNGAQNASTPLNCFEIFFPKTMILTILKHTNSEIIDHRKKYKNQNISTLKNVDIAELKALLGLFIYAGAKRDNHMNIKSLHDPVTSGEMYRASFSSERQHFLMTALRFDDRKTRERRKDLDKLAPVREIWNILIDKCISSYEPGRYLTIAEQLVPFRGRCAFRVCIPNKPAKYGLKIVMMCENGTNYVCNAIPYLGKGSGKSPDYYVERLVEHIKNTGRNVTTDHRFTSIPLANYLLGNGLTTVGTINKNKRELPKEFVDPKFQNRRPRSSLFLFSKDLTAVSYAPIKNKLVTVISTLHDDAINPECHKPEIINCYHQTKRAVDSFDRCVTKTSCIRRSKRWPMCFFYNMLNIALYNAYVIYLHNCFNSNYNVKLKDWDLGHLDSYNVKPVSRFEFLLTVANELTLPWMKCRLQQERIPPTIICSLRKCITHVTGIEDSTPNATAKTVEAPQQGALRKRKYCNYCSYKKKRMSKSRCSVCDRTICGEHSSNVCVQCKSVYY